MTVRSLRNAARRAWAADREAWLAVFGDVRKDH